MKSDNIKKRPSAITDADQKEFQTVMVEIQQLLDHGKVDESTLHRLTNILTTLQGYKESYTWRVINAAKQNLLLD
jgi:hypothetical protein